MPKARDDFPKRVRDALAKRVAYKCSNPRCKALTIGPHSDSTKVIGIGVAAHITAASPSGPRFDTNLSTNERASIENGIWLCQSCARLIDVETSIFTKSVLYQWKVAAESETYRTLLGEPASEYFPQPVGAIHAPLPRIGGLTYDEAREMLIEAGWQPVSNFWSGRSVELDTDNNWAYFWKKGYHEIRNACPTGLAYCDFLLRDVYDNRLIVVTAGEAFEELDAVPRVWNWRFENA